MKSLAVLPYVKDAKTADAARLRTLNTFAVDLIQIPSTEDLFWYVTQNVVGRLNFVDCVIYHADEAGATLRQVAAWGEKNPYGRSILNPLVIPFGSGVTGQAAKTRRPIVVNDLLREGNYIPDTSPARSEICIPLYCRGRVVGVIDSEHPEPNAFGEAELEILTTVAAMAGAKLDLLAESQKSTQRYADLLMAHAQLTQEIDCRKALEAKLFEARRLESVGKLAGRFAHEFNNLLAVILGNLEFLEMGATKIDDLTFVSEARTSAERGARLVRDLLALAQRSKLHPMDEDVNNILHSYVSKESGPVAWRLHLDLADDIWPIHVDRKAIEGALKHLIDNAMDAMGPDGNVEIRSENVLRTLLDTPGSHNNLPPGRYVCLSVSDTGVGIHESDLSRIFDPFFTSKSVGSGTGLGLSIVKGLTEQSGGQVAVTSEVGKGTTFQLSFPALA